jgi:hypothetical protein
MEWDSAVTDGLAKDGEIILFNNVGVSNSSAKSYCAGSVFR